MSDRGTIKGLQAGEFGSSGLSNVTDAVARVHQETFSITFTSTATTNAVQEMTVVQDDVCAGRVKSAKITTPVAVTASDTNYLTFTLAKRTANGSATTIATANTQTGGTGNITAFLPVSLTLTANAVDYAVGDQLTFKALQTGNGAALGLANCNPTLCVTVERV